MVDALRSRGRPVGRITRGTTNPNRLRRFDAWFVRRHGNVLRGAADPLAVDLGYGRAAVTVVELFSRLAIVRPDVQVLGIEIDPERVAAAQPRARAGLTFAHGGFDLAPLKGRRPVLIRAFNVLRQYDEAEVAPAWAQLSARLGPDGIAVDGTCDELGRLASWVVLGADGPVSLVLSWRPASVDQPSQIAARLPKALIHHNVPGQPIHALLSDLDRAWQVAAPLSGLSVRQRLVASCAQLVADGWALRADERQWRGGLLELPWSAVAAVER